VGDLVLFLPFLALFGVIIYMQTRQRKKMQARQAELQAALQVGSPIMLTSGLYGDVAGLDDATVDVEIAPGVVARFARAAVLEVRTSDSVLDEDDGDEAEDDDDGGIDLNGESYLDSDGARNGSTKTTSDTTKARAAKPAASDESSA